MTIKIGEQTLAIRTPKDLDEQLIAATGCDAAEHARMIGGQPFASHLARALHPFVHSEDGAAPSVPELAEQIARAGVDEIRPQVLALYLKRGEQDA